MKKRMLAFALCLVMVLTALPLFASCGEADLSYKGPYLQMYLTQQVYDYDPLHAFNNEAQLKVVSLLYSGLFKVNANGGVENDLVEHVETKSDDNIQEYKMTIRLKETCWSDGMTLDAEDVIYSLKRALRVETSFEAAALLMDIKNAEAVKRGDLTIDAVGISAVDSRTVEFIFERKPDFEQFKLNLASPALVPLREDVADDNPDWAKKPVTSVYSGPFIIRKVSYEEGEQQLILERNGYYFRNRTVDAVDKNVTPYRIIIDYTKTPEEQMEMYKAGQVLYVGDIAMSYRSEYKGNATVTDALSTHTYYLNQNALIKSAKAGEENGFALFAIPEVRQALSKVIDRNAIANSVVFAKAADGIVPLGVFEENSSGTTFRSKAKANLIATGADKAAAEALLQTAGINAADYSFNISVRAGDEVHAVVAEAVAEAWRSLSFNVEVVYLGVENKKSDEVDETGEVQTDIRDDLYAEALAAGNFEVIAKDIVATAVTPISVLAPFALQYTGNALDVTPEDPYNPTVDYELKPNVSGYNSDEYNALIKKAYTAQTTADRAQYLHEAEELLIKDMPVIPILYNQDAYIASGKIGNIGSTYFGYRDLKKVSLSDWEAYGRQYGFIVDEETTAPKKEEEAPTTDAQ